MFIVEEIRKDFPMFENNKIMQNNRFVYLDNASTTFKPKSVINACVSYYEKYNANSHRGDYDIAHIVDSKILETRKKVADFVNASENEIVFTSGTSMSINTIAFGYALKHFKKGDEIILSEAEHASNLLPWFEVAKRTGLVLKYVPLDKEGRITIDNIKSVISNKTRLISLAHVGNVLGYILDVKTLCTIAHEKNILVAVDGAQSVPHMKVDVKEIGCDFLSFSAHKMCGPTGIGVLYGKYELLQETDPYTTGGGMNVTFDCSGHITYLNAPEKFEAGTLNLEAIFGFGAVIDYINSIGIENIDCYERTLRDYAINQLKLNKDLIIYNENAETGIITINYKGVFAQDEATYLNSKGICVRSGEHCAKVLTDFLKSPATVRISLYFYNNKEDVDQLVEALKTGGDFLDAYFN